MSEQHGQTVEEPSTFKAANYHGIEYLRSSASTLYMKTCGMQRCLPGYVYPHNAREGYHLHVVLSGKGMLRAEGKEYQIHKGQMFLLRARDDIFYQADMEDPWYYVWITYCGAEAGKYMAMAGFTDGVYVQECNMELRDFSSIVSDILERPHLKQSSEVYRASLALRFLSLAIESWEKSEEGTRQKSTLTVEDYVNYAVKFMKGNYAGIKISDVADYIGINRTYLTSIFRAKMNMSPQEYLMQVRMDRSRELLLNTDVPIYTVAKEVGYSDQLAFSKIFRKKFNLSPEQYRKKHRDEYTIS
ncbi:MAG: helix-turn-helix domain-containing protein [Clostridia bacterium]|nr:helix-turn-helix domain-containing protein [Clostridia bacterium]